MQVILILSYVNFSSSDLQDITFRYVNGYAKNVPNGTRNEIQFIADY